MQLQKLTGTDEISALVLDPGCSTTRAGFAGEDAPKSVVPSHYGRTADEKYIFGDNAIHTPRGGMQVLSPMAKDGLVDDWEGATKLWEYAITSRLTNPKTRNPLANGLNDRKDMSEEDIQAMELDSMDGQESLLTESPLLMTEPDWNTAKNREKAIEIAIEEWGCPAFWLARSGVLAAYVPTVAYKIKLTTHRFASGKPSALVIDIGASTMSVTPVHDGLILRKGVSKSHLGSHFISDQIRHLFSNSQPPIPLTPYYMVTSKSAVDAGSPAVATYRQFGSGEEPHSSFRDYQEERLLTEFKESVVQVWPGPGKFSGAAPTGGTNEDTVKAQPGRPFEFPDGYNQIFGAERYKPAEVLFDSGSWLGSEKVEDSQTLPKLIQSALNAVDVDIRPNLVGNTVVTGGGSLTQGIVDRINAELLALYPGPRVKVSAAGNLYERRFGPWIGGSILASLGTFHQMWISKKEYDEQGASIVEKRCK
jgi:actin-related protein 4